MKRFAAILVAGSLLAALAPGAALAYPPPNDNPNDDKGEAKAGANCTAVADRQDANGQTGSDTGSDNDEKQLPTAVTNCDHFWAARGSNP